VTPTLTLAAAAKSTGRSESTIRRALTAGRLEGAYRAPDGSWRIPTAALVAAGYLAGTTPADTPTAEQHAPTVVDTEVSKLREALEAAHQREVEWLAAELDRLRLDLDAAHRTNMQLTAVMQDMTRALRPAAPDRPTVVDTGTSDTTNTRARPDEQHTPVAWWRRRRNRRTLTPWQGANGP
jgi:hypothetical protein